MRFGLRCFGRLRPASQYATKPLRQLSHRNYRGRHLCGGAGRCVPLLFTLGGLVGSIEALHYIAREPNPSLKRTRYGGRQGLRGALGYAAPRRPCRPPQRAA